MRTRMLVPWTLTENFFENPEQVQMVINLILAAPCPQTAQGLEGQIAAGNTHDTRDRLGKIAVPTLVLIGKEDLVLPLHMSENLAAGIPNAELTVLDAGGHLVCYEYPAKFNQVVLDFLSKVGQNKS
jgi:pimeloyl-ACP methyl ester carboxylesterase